MNDNFKTFVIVNPNSANRRTGKIWEYIKKELEKNIGKFDFKFTTAPFDATLISRDAVKSGYEMIVAVGGDGTVNEVVNGFFENDKIINSEITLGIISRGTGSDLIKTLGISKEISQAVEKLKGRNVERCDLGKINFVDKDDKEVTRYFINIADFGMGGETVDRVNKTTKFFGGFISFLWGTLITSIKYKNKMASLNIDDKIKFEGKIKNIAIANGRFFGGGMEIAPTAKMDDGFFEVVIISDISYFKGLRIMQKIYKGELIENEKVKYLKGKIISATSSEVVLIDVDGEQPGKLPAKFEILKSMINVKI